VTGKDRLLTDTTMDLGDLWTRALQQLRVEVTGPASRTWLDQTTPMGLSGDTVVLAAPHSFAREQLDIRHGAVLRSALTQAAGRALTVVVVVAPDATHARDRELDELGLPAGCLEAVLCFGGALDRRCVGHQAAATIETG